MHTLAYTATRHTAWAGPTHICRAPPFNGRYGIVQYARAGSAISSIRYSPPADSIICVRLSPPSITPIGSSPRSGSGRLVTGHPILLPAPAWHLAPSGIGTGRRAGTVLLGTGTGTGFTGPGHYAAGLCLAGSHIFQPPAARPDINVSGAAGSTSRLIGIALFASDSARLVYARRIRAIIIGFIIPPGICSAIAGQAPPARPGSNRAPARFGHFTAVPAGHARRPGIPSPPHIQRRVCRQPAFAYCAPQYCRFAGRQLRRDIRRYNVLRAAPPNSARLRCSRLPRSVCTNFIMPPAQLTAIALV